jgi:hypothetical protein
MLESNEAGTQIPGVRSRRACFLDRRRRGLKPRRRPKLELLEERVVPSFVDLTTAGASGTIAGAVYRQGLTHPSGSGNVQSFNRIQQNGVEFGYNTNARPYTDPVLLTAGRTIPRHSTTRCR